MSFYIQLSCGERCLKNGAQLKKTAFIDIRKLPENFWLNLLQEKSPEGLGDVSERLQNDENLQPEDFEVHQSSPVSQCSQGAEPCRDLLAPKPGTCRELKTPLSTRFHDEQRSETPSLFSQEESIDATPSSRGEWLQDGRTPNKSARRGKSGSECEQTAYGSSCSFLPVCTPAGSMAHASRESWIRKNTSTPELLAEIKATESAGLSGLLAASDDESIEEWSESMATPPLNTQRASAADEADNKENLNEEAMNQEEQPPSKRIVRVLFSDGVCDCSEENAALSLENRTIETDGDIIDHDNLQVTVERANGSPEGLLLESSIQHSENTKASNISVKVGLNASFSDESSKPAEATIGGGRPGTLVTTPVSRACDTDLSLKSSLLTSSPWPRTLLSPSAHFHALAQSTPKPLVDDKRRNAAVSFGFTDVQTNESTSDLVTGPPHNRSVPFESPSPSCKVALFQAAQDVSRIHEEASCKLEASALTFGSPSKSFELAMAREADMLCSKVDGDSKTSGLGLSLSASTSDVGSQACPRPSAKTRPTFGTDGTIEVKETVPDIAAGTESDPDRKCSLELPTPGLPEDCGILRRRSFCKVPGLRRSVRPKRFSYPTARQISQKDTSTRTQYRTEIAVDGPRNGLRGACEDTSSDSRAENEIVETLASPGAKASVGNEADNEGGIPAAKRLRTEEGKTEAVTHTNVVKCEAKDFVISADQCGNKESEKMTISSTLPADAAAASWQCLPESRTPSKMVTSTYVEGIAQKRSMSWTTVQREIGICSSVALGTITAVSKSFETVNVPKAEEILFDMDALSQFPVESLSSPSPSNFATGDSLPVLFKTDKGANEDLCKSRCQVGNLSSSYHVENEGCAERIKHKEDVKESELISCNEDSELPLTLSSVTDPSGICISVPPSSCSEYRVVPEFRGFQTASGKNMKVSSEALTKAKLTMKRIDRSLGLQVPHTDNSKVSSSSGEACLRSQNNEACTLSPNGILTVFCDANVGDKKLPVRPHIKEVLKGYGVSCDDKEQQRAGPFFSGFFTASGKGVHLSDSALKKAKITLSKIDAELQTTHGIQDERDGCPQNELKSKELFRQVPKPNDREVSDFLNSLDESKRLDEVECALTYDMPDNDMCKLAELSVQPSEESFRDLYETANRACFGTLELPERSTGLNIQTTDTESLKNVNDSLLEELLSDCGREKLASIGRLKENGFRDACCQLGSSSFRTASGQDVEMSKGALKKGDAIMRQTDRSIDNSEESSDLKSRGSCGFSGFRTASGQDVEMSQEALQKGVAIMRQIDRSLDNSEKTGDPNSRESFGFPSFRTASGQDVQMSKEALNKGAAIMRQIDRSLDNNGKTVDPNSRGSFGFSGFRTASGQDVEMSKEALEKGAVIMRQIDRSLDNNEKTVDPNSGASLRFCGFRTASGQDVQMSKEALKKGAAIMRQIDRSLDNNEKTVDPNSRGSFGFSGFRIASGQDVEMSKEALEKGAVIMRQIDRSLDNNEKTVDPNSGASFGFCGFRTASGQDVQMSKEALKKGAAIMRQIDRSLDNNEKTVDPNSRGSFGFSGFRTASGQDVEMSKEALEKGAVIMRQIDRSLDNNEKTVDPNSGASFGFCGFRTASGQVVEMSNEALKKGAAIMRQIDRSLDNSKESSDLKSRGSCGFSGFRTASGQDIQMSKGALEKGTAIMRQIDRSLNNDGELCSRDCDVPSILSGFKTACGKNAKVPAEALEDGVSFMKVLDQSLAIIGDVRQLNDSGAGSFSGFQTAGGRKVKISDSALAKAKLTISSIDDELLFPSSGIENVDPRTTKSVIEQFPKRAEKTVSCGSKEGLGIPGFSGFQTAGGKKVEVSEDAMAKARAFFEESDVKHTENDSVVLQSVLTETDKGRKTRNTLKTPVPEVNCQGRITPMLEEPLFRDCDGFSQEIIESSNAHVAGDSFIGVSEYLQKTKERMPLTIESVNRTSTYASRVEPSEQGSEGVGAPPLGYRIPRRHSAPLLCSEDMLQQHMMQTRTGLHPVRTTPSGALHDRRVRFRTPFQARLTSANREEAERSSRTFGGMEALKPLQSATPGCFIKSNKHPSPADSSPLNSKKTRSTSSCLRPRFITPYRSQARSKVVSPLARCSTSGSSVSGSEIEGREEDEPSTKKARISETSKVSCSVKPQLGFLSRMRRCGPRMKLREYVGTGSPEQHSTDELLEVGVSQEVLSVRASTASSFRFNGRTFFSDSVLLSNKGVRTEDGGILYVGQDSNVGLDEIQSAFLSTPGVDSQLINELWLTNHYRWIVWKLAAMEVAFPRQFAGRRLTPESVLCELKYRYDREVDHSERSALKRIMERDDVSTRTMVLCVAGVSVAGAHSQGPSKKEEQDKEKHEHDITKTFDTQKLIQVTDGWYAIPVILDRPLTRLLNHGKIFVGQKLCTYGAELVGSEQATSPLEAPPSLMLRLHANSTRRARWDTKLGFHCHTHAFPLSIASLFGDGGLTGCVDVIVLRQYPIQWMEKLPDGTNVFRNSRLEERESKKFEQDRLQRREKLFVKVQEEFEQEFRQLGVEKRRSTLVRRHSMSSRDLKELHDGKEIYKALSQVTDPDAAKACLDERQLRVLEEYTRSLHDKRRAELQSRFEQVWKEQEGEQCHRNVVPLLKVRIADYRPNTPLLVTEERRHAVLSIWRPSEDVMHLLTEGTRLRMYNLTAVGTRYKQSTLELQLSATRTTRYKTMPSDPDVTAQVYFPRQACSFERLRSGSLQPYTEVDLVGVVVFSSPVSSFSSSSIQTIFIADEEYNLVALKFWEGLKAFAVEDLVKPRSFICCSNLVVRPDERHSCPSLCFSELSSIALRPRVPHLRTALDSLQSKIQHMDTFMTQIQKKLNVVLRPNRSSPQAEVKVTTVRLYSSSPESAGSASCGSEFPGPSSTDTILNISTTVNKAADTPTEGNQVTLYESRCKLAGTSGSAASAVDLGAKSSTSKRKLLDSYPEPPPLPALVSPIPASVRREFKRPRRIRSVSAEHNEQ